LGSGSYKTVYRAIDNDTGREVAWNILSTHGLNKKQKQQIRREIELMKKLNHPSILKLITAWHVREREEVVLITEIMTGGSLKAHLQKMRHPRLKLIKQWFRDILQALSYLHSWKPNPIIHRDIKCDNIFISSHTGQIKIGDFGLSTIMNSSCNKTAVGTPHYMAPEIFEERYGPGIDIYAFGMCLLEICTLTTPYKECENPGNIYKKVSSGVKPMNFYMIKDDEVRNFIEMCISKEDVRPVADQLLEHNFLKICDHDEKIHRPVLLVNIESGNIDPDGTRVTKSMELSMMVNSNLAQKVTFNYDLQQDSPQQVAEEIAGLLELKQDHIQDIIKTIEDNIKSTSTNSPTRTVKKLPDSPVLSYDSIELADNLKQDKSTPLLDIRDINDSILKITEDISQRDIIEISLCLSFMAVNHLINENITFPFNVSEDSPELVAEELVTSIGIDSSHILKISELIEQKVLYHTQSLANPFFIEPETRITRNYSSSEDLISLDEESITTPTSCVQIYNPHNSANSTHDTSKPLELDLEPIKDLEESSPLQSIVKLLGEKGLLPSKVSEAGQIILLQNTFKSFANSGSKAGQILEDLQLIRQNCRSRTCTPQHTDSREAFIYKYYEEGVHPKPYTSTFGNINKII